MDIQTPTDPSADDEDTEPDNNTCKRQRQMYAPVDTSRKELTKQRQAQMLKNQQEKERLKVQTDNVDRESRVRTRRPTMQPDDNSDNIDNICLDQKGMLQCLIILPGPRSAG